jgi:hypothetical protein
VLAEEGQAWVEADAEMVRLGPNYETITYWLSGLNGYAWLGSTSGHQWLRTPAIIGWLSSPYASDFLGSAFGLECLRSDDGRRWLQPDDALRWYWMDGTDGQSKKASYVTQQGSEWKDKIANERNKFTPSRSDRSTPAHIRDSWRDAHWVSCHTHFSTRYSLPQDFSFVYFPKSCAFYQSRGQVRRCLHLDRTR